MRSLAPKALAEMMVGATMAADPAAAVFFKKVLLDDFIVVDIKYVTLTYNYFPLSPRASTGSVLGTPAGCTAWVRGSILFSAPV